MRVVASVCIVLRRDVSLGSMRCLGGIHSKTRFSQRIRLNLSILRLAALICPKRSLKKLQMIVCYY